MRIDTNELKQGFKFLSLKPEEMTKFTLSGGNLTIETRSVINGNKKIDIPTTSFCEDLTFIVYGELISTYINKVKVDEVLFEIKDKTLIVNKKLKINTLQSNIFESPFILEEEFNVLNLENYDLKSIYSELSHCIANDNTRIELTGINIAKVKGSNNVKFTTTNSYSVAQVECTVDGIEDLELNVIVPTSLFKNLPVTDFTIYLSNNQVKAVSITETIVAQLIDHSFPDINRILQSIARDSKIKLNKQDILDALDVIETIKDKNKLLTRIEFEETLKLSASNEKGSIEAECISKEYNGNNIVTNINFEMLKNGLKAIKDNELTVYYSAELKPILIESDNLTQVIVPTRTYSK